MRFYSLALLVSLGGCAFVSPSNTIAVTSDPPGVDIYSQPVRFAHEGRVWRHAMAKVATAPTMMNVWGQGLLECWAVKDGRMLKFHVNPESQAAVQIDMSKARAMTADEQKIIQGKIYVGMTEDLVRISWGDPHDINKTTTASGTHAQWVYEVGRYSRNYVYVENGKVTSIQN